MTAAAPRHGWPALPYEAWAATCDTLHAHTQLLGKLAVALAWPEPELQHAALRLTPRGWETAPLPTPSRDAALVAALDLQSHDVVLERSDGAAHRVSLTPNRPVGDVTRDVLEGLAAMVGAVEVNLAPQEVPWSVPLDEDDVHATYDERQVTTYLAAATGAAMVLAAVRAPYRGRSSPVNAWWGTFDLAVALFSGRPAAPTADGFIRRNAMDEELVELGWWPGDARHPAPAFFGFASPAPDGFGDGVLAPSAARYDATLSEYLLEWDDVVGDDDPFGAALAFGRSLVDHACTVCGWDPRLRASARGALPPVT